jgi:hypothetical protein
MVILFIFISTLLLLLLLGLNDSQQNEFLSISNKVIGYITIGVISFGILLAIPVLNKVLIYQEERRQLQELLNNINF